jgi:putative membrane protein
LRTIGFRWRFEEGGVGPTGRFVALLVRLGINASALWVAARVISGIHIGGLGSLVGAAVVFGLVNALIKPVAHALGGPLTCLTLGLFALVINGAMLGLTAWIAGLLDLDVEIASFWAALWGALLISVVSLLLNAFVGTPVRRMFRRGRS